MNGVITKRFNFNQIVIYMYTIIYCIIIIFIIIISVKRFILIILKKLTPGAFVWNYSSPKIFEQFLIFWRWKRKTAIKREVSLFLFFLCLSHLLQYCLHFFPLPLGPNVWSKLERKEQNTPQIITEEKAYIESNLWQCSPARNSPQNCDKN